MLASLDLDMQYAFLDCTSTHHVLRILKHKKGRDCGRWENGPFRSIKRKTKSRVKNSKFPPPVWLFPKSNIITSQMVWIENSLEKKHNRIEVAWKYRVQWNIRWDMNMIIWRKNLWQRSLWSFCFCLTFFPTHLARETGAQKVGWETRRV